MGATERAIMADEAGGKRVMALDPGERRIGVAISDGSRTIALPRGTIRRGPGDIQAICQLAQESEVATIVVGMPYTLRGEVGPAAQRVADFVAELRQATCAEVVTCDERFSSAMAGKALAEGGADGRGRRGRVDPIAATVILQGYLETRNRLDDSNEA